MFPEQVSGYIQDVVSEGALVTITTSKDNYVAIIKYKGLDQYITLLSWSDKDSDYTVMNIADDCYSLIKAIVNED